MGNQAGRTQPGAFTIVGPYKCLPGRGHCRGHWKIQWCEQAIICVFWPWRMPETWRYGSSIPQRRFIITAWPWTAWKNTRESLPWEFLRRRIRQSRFRVFSRLETILLELGAPEEAWQVADQAKGQSFIDFLSGGSPEIDRRELDAFHRLRADLSGAYIFDFKSADAFDENDRAEGGDARNPSIGIVARLAFDGNAAELFLGPDGKDLAGLAGAPEFQNRPAPFRSIRSRLWRLSGPRGAGSIINVCFRMETGAIFSTASGPGGGDTARRAGSRSGKTNGRKRPPPGVKCFCPG